MAVKEEVEGLNHKTFMSIADIVKIDNEAKILRNVVNINCQILNDILINCPPVMASYLRHFIISHNKQVAVVNYLTQEVNDMYYQILSAGTEDGGNEG